MTDQELRMKCLELALTIKIGNDPRINYDNIIAVSRKYADIAGRFQDFVVYRSQTDDSVLYKLQEIIHSED